MNHPYTFAIEHRMSLFSKLSIIYKTPNMNYYIVGVWLNDYIVEGVLGV